MLAMRRRIRPCSSNSQFLVAVAAEPVAAVVAPLISKAYGDAVLSIGPDLLDQAEVVLTLPFARQKGFDGVAAL
jgi:hypothetical protein